jgi:hypothetical protein
MSSRLHAHFPKQCILFDWPRYLIVYKRQQHLYIVHQYLQLSQLHFVSAFVIGRSLHVTRRINLYIASLDSQYHLCELLTHVINEYSFIMLLLLKPNTRNEIKSDTDPFITNFYTVLLTTAVENKNIRKLEVQ